MNLRTSKYNDHLSFCSPNPSEEFCKADHHKPNLTQRGRERERGNNESERQKKWRNEEQSYLRERKRKKNATWLLCCGREREGIRETRPPLADFTSPILHFHESRKKISI